ncbi:MAG: hypothetical protein K9J17_15145 [Flavobacteriales bacterium]|nr:hypothetical protein [Flavobacteriales bacterium]
MFVSGLFALMRLSGKGKLMLAVKEFHLTVRKLNLTSWKWHLTVRKSNLAGWKFGFGVKEIES